MPLPLSNLCPNKGDDNKDYSMEFDHVSINTDV